MKHLITFNLAFWLCVGWAFAQPTFNADIAPIIYNNCTGCHRPGDIGPMPLTNYSEVSSFGFSVKSVTQSKIMPPWLADPEYVPHKPWIADKSLSQEEIDLIAEWVDAGMPEGDSLDYQEPPVYPEPGYLIGTPDLVFQMPQYELTADQTGDVYRNFVLDWDRVGDQYFRGVEIVPDNRLTVHHIILYMDNSGQCRQKDDADPLPGYSVPGIGIGSGDVYEQPVSVWAPGKFPDFYPENMAVKIPATADLVLQVHYAPGSQGTIDQSSVHVVLNPLPANQIRQVQITPLVNWQLGMTNGPLNIPANTTRTFGTDLPLPFNVSVLGVMPHMHLIGRSMRVWAMVGGQERRFININAWDFNWQNFYGYNSPILIPAGSRVQSETTYDNTPDNPFQPSDPPINVPAGESTLEEMLLCYFVYVSTQSGDDNLILEDVVTSRDQLKPEDIGALFQAPYPNPVTDQSTLEFTLDKPSQMSVDLYDSRGRLVKHLIEDQSFAAGENSLTFDLSGVAAGSYHYKLQLNGRRLGQGFTILKR